MSEWDRLFVVIAILWAIAAPFLLMHNTNEPIHQRLYLCSDAAYRDYGSSNARIRLDMDKYRQEVELCSANFSRDFVSIHKVLQAMIGMGERTLGLILWGLILIPIGLLWVVSWALSRVVRWIAAGFLHRT
jgi:hypothetical protein